MKRRITVAIYEQKDNAKMCSESCGVNWLTPGPQQEARDRLKQAYGDKVKIDFYDLDIPVNREKYGQWLERVKEEKLLLPLLVINGEVRINGFFDTRMLFDMVEAEGELGRG
ncbi:MAG: DUF1462 family protein [Chloroflexi bacterium]|nr:DUF1462 family protein [Chloroflexota bacterium]